MKPSDRKKTILVQNHNHNQRLDIFLAKKLKISRSKIQKMIKEKAVKVKNKLVIKCGEIVKEGSKISIKPAKKPTDKLTDKQVHPVKSGEASPDSSREFNRVNKIKNKKFTIKNIKIISETDEYLVINKPAGLLVHPTELKETNVLSKILSTKYPKLKKVGEDPIRPGIVHRLDRDASGLMVVAKTQPMFEHLKQQFKDKTVNKEYAVLVHGKVEADEDDIDFDIVRSKHTERMASIPTIVNANIKEMNKKLSAGHRYGKSRDASTEFWVEKRYINFTLLRVKIHTGRTHQIRVHMLAYNHPVVGDNIYFQKKQRRKYDTKCGRLFLHSTYLSFKDLDNKTQEFKIELPKKLSLFLEEIK